MFDMMLVLVIIVLIIMGVVQIKGWVWLRYKALYFKRLIWVQLGRCPKCGHKLSYTTKGRSICTNGDCR